MGVRAWRVGAAWGAAAGLAAPPLAAPAFAQTAQAAPPVLATPPPAEPPIDPAEPLAALPGIGVGWPDLAVSPGASAPDAAVRAAADRRYGYRVDGLGVAGTALLRDRFDDASSLRQHRNDPTNAAQLDRRAREDAQLLTDLLRAAGYYDAQVATRVEAPSGDKPQVVLAATPGVLYRLGGVTVNGLAATDGHAEPLRRAFGLKPGDAADADAVAAAQARLTTGIGDAGFPFAHVGSPELTVDRAARTATLDLDVTPGGERRFGRIVANAGNHVFDADHIADIARFSPGDPYDAAQVADLRRALIQTGLVSVADVKPVQAADPTLVDLDVHLERAPPRTVAGELGYGTGEGAVAELSWTHRNLFPPEGALTLRGVLGTKEQLASIVFRRNNFEARDHVLTAEVDAAHTVRAAYDARTLSLSGTLERQTNIFFQKTWTWSVGGEVALSDERDVDLSTGLPRRLTYYILAVPTNLAYDGSDDLLNPTKGFRLGGRLSPELSLNGDAFGYARVQLDGSAYQPISRRVVLAERVRFGTIIGAPRDAIAPSRRFYAGGGASVRGYGYQDIGPRDGNNNPIGGRSLTELSAEARIKLFGSFGLVPFLDAGTISTGEAPPFTGLHYGTGLGVRYYSSFGPIRVDLGTPINPEPGDARVAVYVSLGQAF